MDQALSLDSSLAPRRRRILCAEDHVQMADLIRTVLERAGHEVVCVFDGLEAWQHVQANPGYFDVVVTDFQMPHLTGLELVRNLKRIGFAGKIVVQSGRLSPRDDADLARLGNTTILHKPGCLFALPKLIG